MAEILHHLGWLKPYKQWDNHHPWWCRISAINSIKGHYRGSILPCIVGSIFSPLGITTKPVQWGWDFWVSFMNLVHPQIRYLGNL